MPKLRRAGRYRVVWSALSDGQSATRRLRLQVVSGKGRLPQTAARGARADVLVAADRRTRDGIARSLGTRLRVTRVDIDASFELTGSWRRNVRVVVVDVDELGLRSVRDLRAVFPDLRIVALTSGPGQRRRALQAGATTAVPRAATPRRLAEVVARLAGIHGTG